MQRHAVSQAGQPLAAFSDSGRPHCLAYSCSAYRRGRDLNPTSEFHETISVRDRAICGKAYGFPETRIPGFAICDPAKCPTGLDRRCRTEAGCEYLLEIPYADWCPKRSGVTPANGQCP